MIFPWERKYNLYLAEFVHLNKALQIPPCGRPISPAPLQSATAAWNPADEGQKKAAREGGFSLQGGVKNWTTSKDNPKEGIV